MQRFDGSTKRLAREHNERAGLAWLIVVLGRQKRVPKLDKLLVKNPGRRRQTWQEQMQVMDMWVAVSKRIAREKKPKDK